MDELKLNKWKADFLQEMRSVEMEFNSYVKNVDISKFYCLNIKETSDELSLYIKDDLPTPIKERIEKIFLDTKPEDSV